MYLRMSGRTERFRLMRMLGMARVCFTPRAIPQCGKSVNVPARYSAFIRATAESKPSAVAVKRISPGPVRRTIATTRPS